VLSLGIGGVGIAKGVTPTQKVLTAAGINKY